MMDFDLLILSLFLSLWAALVVFYGCLKVPSYRILAKAVLFGLPLSAAIILGYAAFLKSLGVPVRLVDLWKPSVALQGWMCVSFVLWFIWANRHMRAMILQRSMIAALDPDCHAIEAEIRYLTTAEGGRKDGVSSGYRGQFYYQGEDWDGFQYFPDFSNYETIQLGRKVRAIVPVSPGAVGRSPLQADLRRHAVRDQGRGEDGRKREGPEGIART